MVAIVVVLTAALVPVVKKGLHQFTSAADGPAPSSDRRQRKGPEVQFKPLSGSEVGDFLERVNHAAYDGDLRAVQALLDGEKGTSNLLSEPRSLQSPIHSALQGRHDSLSRDISKLIGQHEEVIHYLTEYTRLSTSHGCPIYYAVHYRNIRALEILLNSSDANRYNLFI